MHLDPYRFCSCVVVLTMSFPRFLFGLNCARGMKKNVYHRDAMCYHRQETRGTGGKKEGMDKGSLREQEGGYCWY